MMHMQSQRGFTLVELIVVIVITGILGSMVAIFIQAPVQGYVDSSRRAEMTDIADTALRRIGRDLRAAVPNSIRLPAPAGSTYIEFLPTVAGGRYRADPGGSAGTCGGSALGDALSFDAADTCFGIIGPPIAFAAGDAIIIGSTQSDGNQPYQGVATATSVRRMIAPAGAGTQAVVRINSAVPFPASAELPGQRFQVVPATQLAVTYACVGPQGVDANGDGTAALTRYWAYGLRAAQLTPAAIAALGLPRAILADRLSVCNFVYDTSNQRNGLVAINLTITRGGGMGGVPESISLYHEVHVNNVP